ncbi:MAG: cupin domain-containing protein [Myxococcaceae bacterium]|nr:cupin domain-containing protein [Myxococcaceae bacterium]MCI0669614.1 cupin domain-containing protein [Myxococcaceae bacterium]
MRWMTWLSVLCAASSGVALAGAGKGEVRHFVEGRKAPVHLIAGGKGSARVLLDASTGASAAALTLLTLAPGAAVPEHVHEGSTEILYIEEGTLEMTVAGKVYTAGPGDAVYIPAGVKHAAKVAGRFQPLRAVQVYVGPGPEQRFLSGERVAGD